MMPLLVNAPGRAHRAPRLRLVSFPQESRNVVEAGHGFRTCTCRGRRGIHRHLGEGEHIPGVIQRSDIPDVSGKIAPPADRSYRSAIFPPVCTLAQTRFFAFMCPRANRIHPPARIKLHSAGQKTLQRSGGGNSPFGDLHDEHILPPRLRVRAQPSADDARTMVQRVQRSRTFRETAGVPSGNPGHPFR